MTGGARPSPTGEPVQRTARSRRRLRALCSQALADMLRRPARSILTALGTVLGVGTLVAVVGLTAGADRRLDDRFDVRAATEVIIEDTGGADPAHEPLMFTADADRRVGALNGVEHAGVQWTVELPPGTEVRAAPVGGDPNAPRIPVLAASPGFLRAAGPHWATGRGYDTFHDGRAEQVAVLGADVAEHLGVGSLDTAPAVFVGDTPFTVVGILAGADRRADLLRSVLIPRTTAERVYGPPGGADRARMLVTTRNGAARQVAGEAPYALRPDAVDAFRPIPPPDPGTLRGHGTGDRAGPFLLLAGLCLLIGAVGIAGTTLVAVQERTPEIGLRRALGAGSRDIACRFLLESAGLGALGGLVGTSLGAITIVVTAAARHWPAVVDPAMLAAGPLIGLAIGLLAGLPPAWHAARIRPAAALRR